MVVIGHLHFSFFAVCVEAIGCPLGVLGSCGIFVVGVVWILLVVDTSKRSIVESTHKE
jgi:hypothetical protein